MMTRLTYALHTFSAGITASLRAALRLQTQFLLACLATMTLWSGLSFAVPAGTVISNTAEVSFDVSSTTYTLLTNTDEFTVESILPADTGSLAVTGLETSNLYPGSGGTLNINLENSGSNTLENGFLTITTTANVQLDLSGAGATLVSESTSSNMNTRAFSTNSNSTTREYSISNIAVAGAETYQAELTLPLDIAASSNLVTIQYRANNQDISQQETTLNISSRSEGNLQLLQYSTDADATPLQIKQPSFKNNAGIFVSLPVPEIEGAPGVRIIDAPITLKEARKFNHNQIIYIRLEDHDQNINQTSPETIEIEFSISEDGESETFRLTENGNNSGIFTGYVMLEVDSVTSNDGMLEVRPDTEVDFNYTDLIDHSDASLQVVLVDPFGVLFDSATGAYLNGYTVQMINTDTGQPATVYGDDGISSYPATVVTGGSVTDSSGAIYHFSDGAYRFPFAPLGNYKLVVVPPAAALYRWPSSKASNLINQLPNAPYSITLGSRGETFPLVAGPPLHIDIPVDALNTQMYIQRSASKDKVAPGDFIQYNVSLENIATVAINDVNLTDTLPHGFRIQTDSLLINDAVPASPTVAQDGQQITFNLGNMNSGDINTIEYVAAVGAVNKRNTSSSSHAIANAGAATSNTAEHDVQILDELMRSRALLMGQVIINPRDDETQTEPRQGLADARIYMEDGRYAVTDKRGMYHFENVSPGSHLLQLDLDTIPEQYEVLLNENNSRFAGRAWSQFVDVQGGTLWRTDFHIANKPVPEGNVAIQISNKTQQINGDIPYLIDIHSETVSIENMRLNVLIPEGSSYKSGSSSFDGKSINDPDVSDNMLTYRLGNADAKNWDKTLRFTITPAASDKTNEMISKAFMLFNTVSKQNQRTPVADHVIVNDQIEFDQLVVKKIVLDISYKKGEAQITAEDKQTIIRFAEKAKALKDLRIHAVGHSDNLPVKWIGSMERFGDNYNLSAHRARAVANELRDLLNLPPSQITIEGRGPDEPIADNGTAAGRAANRRVEIYIYRVDSQIDNSLPIKASEGKRLEITTRGKDPAATSTTTSSAKQVEDLSIVYDANWLKDKDAAIEWLQPAANSLPKQTSTEISIKHHKEQKVGVILNGKPVPNVNFEGMLKNNNDAGLSQWQGVDLLIGSNVLEATITDNSGNIVKQITRQVHVSGGADTAQLVKDKSTLIADGRNQPVIALKVIDKDGQPLRPGMTGQISIKPPYQIASNSNFNIENMPGTATQDKHSFTVDADGIALIKLEPSNKTGEVELELITPNQRQQIIKAKLKTEQRDWILVGLAEGTTGYDTVAGNKEALGATTKQDHLYQDGRIAFFAKGQVLGKWLLTMAYDSDKQRLKGEDPNINQSIDPGSYYTIYGDSSNNGNDASSSEKLFLMIERDNFYLLFGDYATSFNQTQLASYSRTLTGIKTRFEGDNLDVAIFTSQTNQSFVKEEFRGESRSGPYPLSRSNIAMNTEKVIIETRDRFRSEEILESVELTRHSDYDIDYRNGTITFRKPVFSINENMDHVFVVIKYEAFDDADERATYGGRAKLKINDKLSVGITHVNEGRTGGEAKLGGVDVEYQATKNTQIHLEAARTIDNNIVGANGQGDAYIAELEHQTNNSSSKAYVHETDTGFGLGQTNGSEDSSRKVGAETTVKISNKVNIHAQAYRQEQTATKATRDLAEAEATLNLDIATLRLGTRTAIDQRGDGSEQKSEQITAGASKGFFDNKLVGRIDHEKNINDDNSIDYPDRTRLGVDVRLSEKATLFAEQEISNGKIRDTRNTLLGIKSNPWDGGTLYTGVTNSQSNETESTSANIAGTQTWQLTDAWSLDIGAEQSKLLSVSAGTQLNNNLPFASGAADDFTAASVGLTYMAGDWMWASRIENRNGDMEDRRSLSTSVQTTPNASLSTLASLQYTESNQVAGSKQTSTNIGLGLAYHPSASKWIFLDKLELQRDDTTGSSFDSETKRIINMFHANYKTGRWQLSLQYGAKVIREIIKLQTYRSFTDLAGFETRYDLTSKWDIGLHGNVLRSKNLNQYDYNSGLSIGHYLAKNIWISLGYNFTGFRDEDFSRSNYTSEGWFMKFRIKFDQQSVKEGLEWLKN